MFAVFAGVSTVAGSKIVFAVSLKRQLSSIAAGSVLVNRQGRRTRSPAFEADALVLPPEGSPRS